MDTERNKIGIRRKRGGKTPSGVAVVSFRSVSTLGGKRVRNGSEVLCPGTHYHRDVGGLYRENGIFRSKDSTISFRVTEQKSRAQFVLSFKHLGFNEHNQLREIFYFPWAV